uniref:Xylanolytic transcriptional activator regulatory domain-containing protein n=1 Tax=Moniliophthora roreri TaxID=221103 RepID=A0A0W0F023_MONRR
MPDEDGPKEIGTISANHERFTPKEPVPRLFPIPAADLTVDVIRKWDSGPTEDKRNDEVKDEEDELLALSDSIRRLIISPDYSRFYGKSSGIMLIQTANDLKEEYTKEARNFGPFLPSLRRPGFWQPQPWEHSVCQIPRYRYDFPAEDLMNDLVDLYFKNINIFIPLLHRPTFERDVAMKLHLKNDMFGAILLLVCANGSRYSDDPRVLLDGVDSWTSCGWKWFDQVHLVQNSLLSPGSLYDLQFYSLSSLFLLNTSAIHRCWTMVGTGIRLAQDMGAHRRQISPRLTVEAELMKRAFWTLVCIDRVVSASMGRPCAVQDEDLDLDMPIECDDDYLVEHPDPQIGFRQPPGRPSYVAAFTSCLKLMRLLAMALRTIYSINQSKLLLGLAGPEWEQRIVTELDSALNQWVDSVPEHLKWDPNREDDIFFNQDSDSPRSADGSAGNSPGGMATVEVGERNLAGTKRAMRSASFASPTMPLNQPLFSLPMYSEELGRLPVHGQLRYTSHGNQGTGVIDTTGGYWFASQEVPQMSPTSIAGGTAMDSSMGALYDFSLPAGYPAFVDAEFFDQLASMTWPSGGNLMADASGGSGDARYYMGVDGSSVMLSSPYQHAEASPSSATSTIWSHDSSNSLDYGVNDPARYSTDVYLMHNTQAQHSHIHNPRA